MKGELNERGPATKNGLLVHYPFDGDTKSSLTKVKIVAERYGTNAAYDGGIWAEDGTLIRSYSRDWHISVWDMRNNKWATGINFHGASRYSDGTHAIYDTYDSTIRAAQQQAFADTLNALTGDYIVIIGAAHAPEYFNAAMVTAIKRCGGTAANLSWIGSRKSYICVGEVGCGEGNAIVECLDNMTPSPGQTTWAEAEVGLYGRPFASTSTVVIPSGIALEDSVTNILPHDGSFATASGEHRGNVANSNGTGTTLGGGWRASTHYNDGIGKIIRSMTPLGEGNIARWVNGATPGWKAFTAGAWYADAAKTYTVSVYVRVSGNTNPSTYAFYGDASNRLGFIWEKNPRDFQGEWVRGTRTFSPTVSQSGSIYLYGDSGGQEGSTIDYCLFQIEERAYPTTFTNTSRTAATNTVRVPIGTSDFTIIGEFTPNANSDNLPNSCYFLNLGNGMILRTYNGAPYVDGNVIVGASNNNVHIDFNTVQGVPVQYVIQRSGTRFSWRMKSQDGQDRTWVKTDTRVAGFMVDSLIFHYSWGGVHRNLSVYNRALSDAEINKALSGAFSIEKTGSLLSKAQESPSKLPMEAFHFPLGQDAKSLNKDIAPTQETDTAYEDGAVWLGKATVNLSNTSWMTGFENSGTGTRTNNSQDLPPLYPGIPIMKYTLDAVDATSGGSSGVIQVGVTGTVPVSTAFSASCWVWLDVPSNETNTVYLRQYWDGGNGTLAVMNHNGITNIGLMPQKQWIKVQVSNAVSRADLNPNLRINVYLGNVGGRVYFTAPQIEQSKYVTPFVNGTRSYNRVYYSSADIGVDNTEFTIMMWMKYEDLSTWQLSGDWGRFYIGPYANSYLRFSWMENSANTGNVNTQRTANTSGFTVPKDKWIHVAYSVKENISIDIYANGKRYCNWTSPFLLTTAPNRFELNSFNGSTSYPLNAWMRDLVIVPKALTSTEIEDIYKKQMQAHKQSRLQVQGQIREGKVL